MPRALAISFTAAALLAASACADQNDIVVHLSGIPAETTVIEVAITYLDNEAHERFDDADLQAKIGDDGAATFSIATPTITTATDISVWALNVDCLIASAEFGCEPPNCVDVEAELIVLDPPECDPRPGLDGGVADADVDANDGRN
jgi:hypothetical protein